MKTKTYIFVLCALGGALGLVSKYWHRASQASETTLNPETASSSLWSAKPRNAGPETGGSGSDTQRVRIPISNTIVDAAASFQTIWSKAVLTEDELELKKRLLQDESLLNSISQRLAAESLRGILAAEGKAETVVFPVTGANVPFIAETLERQKYVRILAQALSWKENPARNIAISAVKYAILSPNLETPEAEERRKSLIGDKIELYAALHITDRVVADSVFNEARGYAKKIIAYTRKALLKPGSTFAENLFR